MKFLTLKKFIILTIIVIILHPIISRTSVPIIISMKNIDTILYAIPQKNISSHIYIKFNSSKAIVTDITDFVPQQAPIPQTNYLPLKKIRIWVYLRRSFGNDSYMHFFYLLLLAHV